MTAPTPSVISGDCCIPFSNFKAEEHYAALFKVYVHDEFTRQSDLTYHINFGDGTTLRNQTLKWTRKYGHYIEVPHTYLKRGIKNAFLFVENKKTLRKAKCGKILVEVSPMRSLTPTPTVTPSISISPTATPSVTKTPTKTPSVTPSISHSITPTKTSTPSKSISSSPTATPSVSVSLTPSPTSTPSESISVTPTSTATPSTSISASPTPTKTPSASISVTPTRTATPSLSISPTPSQTPTPSVSISATPTPSVSISATPTRTVTPTQTLTPTPTPTCLTQKLCVRFQYPSTYVVEGQNTGVRVYRESCACEDYLEYTGAFTIEYRASSQPLSAQEGLDFHSQQTGTLHFGVGENMKIIPITTIDDLIHEGSEFFNLFLENIQQLPCVEEKILYKNPYQVLITDNDPCPPSISPSPSATPSISVSATPTQTPTPSISVSATPTQTPTPSISVSATPTQTPTPSISVSATPTQTPTPSISVSATPTQTPTPSISVSATPTQTPTPSISISVTPTQTSTPTPTPSSVSFIQKFELCDTTDLTAGTGNQKFQMVPHDSPNVWGTGYISTGLAYTGGLLTEAQTGSFRV